MGRFAVVVALLLFVQDGSGWSTAKRFAKSGDVEDASSVRKTLGSDALGRGLRAILLQIEVDGDKKAKKALSKYFAKVPNAPSSKDEHLAALKVAIKTKNSWLAWAHVDRLIALGAKPEKEIKALKLLPASDNRLATDVGSRIARAKRIEDGGEVEKIMGRVRDPGATYFTAVALMRSLSRDKKEYAPRAAALLTALRRWRQEHVAHLSRALNAFAPCSSCNDTRELSCYACKGKGVRVYPCPNCGGSGDIPWDPAVEKSDYRKGIDKRLGYGPSRSYCAVCGRHAEHKQNRKPCTFCEQKGKVECQRCKFWVVDFGAIGSLRDCGNCNKTGLYFENVLVPCPFCHGVGAFIEPTADGSATVGPTE